MHLLAVFRNGFQETFQAEVCSIWRSETQMNKAGFRGWENRIIKGRCRRVRVACVGNGRSVWEGKVHGGEEASQVGRDPT